MNLSEHFTLEELTYSDTAKAYKISNKPTEAHLKVLKHTCTYLLEPLRALLNQKYGKCSIHINSGYRGEQLNTKVGGVKTSEHCKGQAVDIKVKRDGKVLPYIQVYEDIKQWVKEGKLSVNQCILETAKGVWWVHVSHSAWGKSKDKREFLKYNNGKYTLDCKLR